MEKKTYTTEKDVRTEMLVNDLKQIGSFDTDGVMQERVGNANLIVLEKFYLRNSSAASCSICLERIEDHTEIVVICSGAGQGLLNMSLGATSNLIKKVDAVIQKYL